MVVLDTNVLSEIMRAAPSVAVLGWIEKQPLPSMFISAVSEAELRFGLAVMPNGRRRSTIAEMIEKLVRESFAGRILPFDSDAAAAFADVAMTRRAAGRPIGVADAQIAAIVRSRGATLATRNMRDFEGCGIELVDPWR